MDGDEVDEADVIEQSSARPVPTTRLMRTVAALALLSVPCVALVWILSVVWMVGTGTDVAASMGPTRALENGLLLDQQGAEAEPHRIKPKHQQPQSNAVVSNDTTRPQEVYLFRHCDKKRDPGYECNQQGVERAYALSWYFWRLINVENKRVGAIIVAKSGGDCQNSYRPIQTVQPLAHWLNMAIDSNTWCTDQNWEMAHYILTRQVDGVIVIAYEHKNLPILTHYLGVDPQPPEYPGDRFDIMFHIQTNVSGNVAKLEITPEGLAIAGTRDSPLLPEGYLPWAAPGQPINKNALYYVWPWPLKVLVILVIAFAVIGVLMIIAFVISCICIHQCSATQTVKMMFQPEYIPLTVDRV